VTGSDVVVVVVGVVVAVELPSVGEVWLVDDGLGLMVAGGICVDAPGLVSGGVAPSGLGAGVDGTATPSSAPEPNTVGTFVTWDRTLPTAREATMIEKAARASQAAESRRGDRISIFLLSSSTEEINHG
jgi:hypothetical protein